MKHTKLIDPHTIDMPVDDVDCWYRYPKHRWVYDMSRLMDIQGIEWSLFHFPGSVCELTHIIYSKNNTNYNSGSIYINPRVGNHLITEIYLSRGEIKYMCHIDPISNKEIIPLMGSVELKLNAFVILHFSKFTGVLSTETCNDLIYRIRLRPQSQLSENRYKNALRIYKTKTSNATA